MLAWSGVRDTLRAWLLAACLPVACVLAAWLPPSAALAQAPATGTGLQPVPALTARVVDTIGLLDAAARQSLEDKLAALEREKGSQVAFLVVATTQPEDIAAYANRVANEWKIGRRQVGDGVLLVLARDDRRVRIEVAKTLEGAIPDLAAKRIIDEAVTPAFRQGDYAAGLHGAADRIGALVRGEALPEVARAGGGERGAGDAGFELTDLAVFLFFAVPIAAAVLRGLFGRKLGSLLTGGGVGLVAFLATTSVVVAVVAALVGAVLALAGISPMGRRHARHHPGRWSGPALGGWSAGGQGGGWSGGAGGFSAGGGGDFGGGGASGDW